jgi:Flp pilus assembly protein TadG
MSTAPLKTIVSSSYKMRAHPSRQPKLEAASGKAGAGVGRKGEAGQAIALVALGLVVLLGFVGLGIDIGQLRYVKRRVQSAADSAAIAGAQELLYSDVSSAAKADSATNGFTDGVSGATVTVNNPPLSGPHTGSSLYVEAIVSENQPTFFAKVLGISSATVSGRAVATQTSGSNCIFALSPTATDAILANGSQTITASCGSMDDSSASQAFLNNGSGTFSTTGNGVVGGYLNNGTGSISPTPATGVPPTSDPLAYLVPPTWSSCTYSTQVVFNGSGPYTAYPGTYCAGMLLNGSGNLTLNPGLYIINGSSLIFNGSGTVTGSGVTFYLTNSASATLNGSQTFQLTAPTIGSYTAILFFQNKSDTSNATINGSNTSNFTGALYFPGAQLTYNGSGPLSAYTILVANTIVFNGSSNISDNYSSLPGGVSPIANAVLVE